MASLFLQSQIHCETSHFLFFFLHALRHVLANFLLEFDKDCEYCRGKGPIRGIRNASLECLWGFQVVSLIWIDISRVSGPLNSHKPATASKGPFARGVPNASTLQCLKQFNQFSH